jgi:hypothetical protein
VLIEIHSLKKELMTPCTYKEKMSQWTVPNHNKIDTYAHKKKKKKIKKKKFKKKILKKIQVTFSKQ